MASLETPICNFGWKAENFNLLGIDGKRYDLETVRGQNGLLIMFICNHCPYVKAVLDRIVRDVKELHLHGIGAIAIMSNDPLDYPEDSFDNMALVAKKFDFSFPYVLDESQQVAKAYGAVCTPDFFGLNNKLELQYRGRLDASRREAAPVDVRRDLFEGMLKIAETSQGPDNQIPSIGCSIKWRVE
ncbi:MAG: thioredoxin family protein [Nitrosomonadales bacterium]|jgi:peroxiredoxin|nr:MAG: thioredoxin family protein [Nitrosomonadales bacterium]